MRKSVFKLMLLFCLIILFTIPQTGEALTIVGNGSESTEGLGDFQAEIIYNPDAKTSGTMAYLYVTMTNTSSQAFGGFLTAFAFNNPSLNNPNVLIDGVSIVMVTVEENNEDVKWTELGGDSQYNNGIKAEPFGYFDIGASMNGSWLGKGNPKGGIEVNGTIEFTFTFLGMNLDTLDEWSFVNETSVDSPKKLNPTDYFFAARFMGFDHNPDSDKVPGMVVSQVPEPSTLVLLGTCFVGLAGIHRKRFFEKS
jgi:hypothetical protein